MNFTLKELQILRNKKGIYFLYDEIDICYIGQSANMYLRLLEHCFEGTKKFTQFKAVEINDDDFRELMESYLIRHYQDFTMLYNKIVIPGDFEYYFMTLPSSIRNKYDYESFIDTSEEIASYLKTSKENTLYNEFRDFEELKAML